MSKGFLTIAYGAPKYIRMGKALARSMRLYNTGISLAVVTDKLDKEMYSLYDIVIPVNYKYGSGVKQKLFLDKYTPFEETIYIDSDCLVYRDPVVLWEMYKRYNKSFGIKGWGYLGPNDTHYSVNNLKKYLSTYGVKRIAEFNSGLFYFDESKEAMNVFETARCICDDNELKEFKNSSLNDEPVFAMAMELNQIDVLPWDNGEAMSTPSGKIKEYMNINVLRGRSDFVKNGFKISPTVIHFHIRCQDYFIYKRDIMRLEIMQYPMAGWLANIFSFPDYFLGRIRYYSTRLVQRKNKYGYLGLVPMPERFCDFITKASYKANSSDSRRM